MESKSFEQGKRGVFFDVKTRTSSLREVVALQPYKFRFRKKKRGTGWTMHYRKFHILFIGMEVLHPHRAYADDYNYIMQNYRQQHAYS